jgi:hypothetical protein
MTHLRMCQHDDIPQGTITLQSTISNIPYLYHMYVLILTKTGLGSIQGEFFTNSSGRTVWG